MDAQTALAVITGVPPAFIVTASVFAGIPLGVQLPATLQEVPAAPDQVFWAFSQKANTKKVIPDSEPCTEKFYAKLRFTKVGQLETSIKDRYLPIMELATE